MIEINLIPDVKRELLRTQKVRSAVVSASVLVTLGAVGAVTVLTVWVIVIQATRGVLLDSTIKSQSSKLADVQDLSNALTIQQQLGLLDSLHQGKSMSSRALDVLATINPPSPNELSINRLTIDTDKKTIKVEAQAANGYTALEVFKKTITATKLQYVLDDKSEVVSLADGIIDSDRSYGEDAAGKKVLRFTLAFSFADELLDPSLIGAKIVAPTKTNVTDSYLGIPQSLFSEKASDTGGAN